jgi:hypothetical protein
MQLLLVSEAIISWHIGGRGGTVTAMAKAIEPSDLISEKKCER